MGKIIIINPYSLGKEIEIIYIPLFQDILKIYTCTTLVETNVGKFMIFVGLSFRLSFQISKLKIEKFGFEFGL